MNANPFLRAGSPRVPGTDAAVRAVALRRESPRNGFLRWLLLAATTLAAASAARATDFYASPAGSASGNGSMSSPWNLQTALNQTVAKPGDTIWLRGGVYPGTYSSYLNGTSAAPIVVRQYPGERATIDGGNSGWTSILMVSGSYTWYWGFEVTSSDPNRVSQQTGSNPTDIGRGNIATEQTSRTGAGLKFINLIVHDIQDAGLWKEALNSEFYGSVIYYDGWNAPDRGHGHGLYLQNLTGTMSIQDNVIFENFQNGIQCYGSESAYLNNFDIEGNTIFNNGSIVASPANNIIIGGGVVAQNPIVANNNLYYAAWGNGINLNMGYYPYGIGASNPKMTGNYSGNGEYDLNSANTNTTLTGNSIYSSLVNWSSSQYPSNTFYSGDPGNLKVIVRPNKYEPGRANITVFNWGLAAAVSVDVSSVLSVGQAFEVRNAQDWFGAPVLSGTYAGGSIALPMTGLTVAVPVGWAAPPPSGPEFNVFVLLPKSAGTGGTAPDPHFSVAPNPVVTNQTAQFTDTSLNSPTSWSWNFGDGSTASTAKNPTHVYAGAGTYTVRLTATNSSGSASTTNTVTVNPATSVPVPSFSFSPSAPAPNQSVQFTDTTTGSPTSWSWTFGDGATSTLESPTHVYAAAGAYTATLKATNAAGSASASAGVTIASAAQALPDPHFSITPNPATAGQTVQLTDTTLNSPTSWSWNFGDTSSGSNTSTAKNPTHVYAAAGTYTIRLTATNSAGSASTTNTVTVNAAIGSAPAASFTARYSGTSMTEQFTDSSTGSPTSWSWNFGDTASGAANTSTVKNPSHKYTKTGTFLVTLTVKNTAGSSAASHSLSVSKFRVAVSSTSTTVAVIVQR